MPGKEAPQPSGNDLESGVSGMGFIKRHPTLMMGIGITLLFLWLGFFRLSFFDNLELKRYDLMMGLRGEPEAASNIVMVDIDDDSIDKLGRWPWPRSLIARGITAIDNGGPKVIGLNFVFSEPEESSGLQDIRSLEKTLIESGLPPLRSHWKIRTR